MSAIEEGVDSLILSTTARGDQLELRAEKGGLFVVVHGYEQNGDGDDVSVETRFDITNVLLRLRRLLVVGEVSP